MQSGLCLDVGSSGSCMEKPWSTYPYCNYQLDANTRAMDLVSRLTLDEKVGVVLGYLLPHTEGLRLHDQIYGY